MKIFNRSTNAVIIGGVFFLTPLLILIILISHALKLLFPIGRKLVDLLSIHSLFGAATVTIITVFILLLICYISGFLVQKGLVNDWGQKMEDRLFLLFPSMQMLKYRLLGDKPKAKHKRSENWKAILLQEELYYRVAFITETKDNYYSIFIPDAPKLDAGEVRFFLIKNCRYIPISMKEAMKALNSFGRDANFGGELLEKPDKTIEKT
ncbi:hypothetical protein [Galbibacter pacificus]|uniref:DUF502 domain-containing protein n=1 Tax=Galbibacter pacificus TaxID=2996052 RepID=A0ABT6FW80_9FLAO|nr:hypothetical protein [Galbibacter pacificus]MDG3584044.1 hypothetical protein [Galbibacter pacificus]MDG3587520.1 hypothetical protein [Galbibacter pacificus]